MKKSFTSIRVLGFIFSVFALVSCNTYTITTNVLVPAEITISPAIQTVGVVNRSLPEKSNMLMNIAEGFISGESILADRIGSGYAIRGVVNTLNANPRLKAVSLEGEELKGTGTKSFPLPLDWNKVEELCKKYNVDAIVALETFDSDILLREGKMEKTRKTKEGREEKYFEFTVDLFIRVNTGWRFYDNINKKLIDEKTFTDEKFWSASGLTPQEALANLPPKREAINVAASFAGEMLAFRISPKWLPVSRVFFVKGKKHEHFKKAKDKVKTNQWNEIFDLMEPITRVTNPKIKARAMHNIAVAFEMEGDLKSAIEWEKKAYETHKRPLYREYFNALNRRLMDQAKLEEQMRK